MLLVLGGAFFVYFPGLSGSFIFDDVANITRNPLVAIHQLSLEALLQAADSGRSGPLGRPVSMVSFALNHYFSGFSPYYFKLTNLAIHLLNCLGIFLLSKLLLSIYCRRLESRLVAAEIAWISLAVSAAWLLHPLNLTSVLYVVQRMTALSAFFSIWGLLLFLWGRSRLQEGGSGAWPMLASIVVFVPLAALSKENGALLPILMLTVEVTLFAAPVAAGRRNFLRCFYGAFVALPLMAVLAYLVVKPQWLLAGFQYREFTLIERAMTEARVLLFYIRQILLPDAAQMGLYLDDFPVSRGLFSPVSTFVAIVAIAGGTALLWLLRRRMPLVAFGGFFFLAGHLLESTVYPLDIAYEHRNYLPMYGLLLPTFFYLLHPREHVSTLRARRMAGVVLILFLAAMTYARAKEWANPYDLAQLEYRHHPDSVRANIELGAVFAGIRAGTPEGDEHYYRLALQHFARAADLNRNDTGAVLESIRLSASRGRSIDAALAGMAMQRLQRSHLAADTGDKLLQLTKCFLSGQCTIQEAFVTGLLDAALSNPLLQGGNRVKVLYAKSSWLMKSRQDYPFALRLMREMVAIVPEEPAARFVLIDSLIAARRTDEAAVEMQHARQTGMSGADAEKLDALALKLDQHTFKPTTQ